MGITENPNCFRFEGAWWVSELPRDEMRAQLTEQRAWDSRNAKLQRWWIAIAIGGVLGIAGTIWLSMLAGFAGAVYLLVLPVGFGIGAVLGALVNKRLMGDEAQHPSMGDRPVIQPVTRIPSRIAKRVEADTSAAEVIDWSTPRSRNDRRESD